MPDRFELAFDDARARLRPKTDLSGFSDDRPLLFPPVGVPEAGAGEKSAEELFWLARGRGGVALTDGRRITEEAGG